MAADEEGVDDVEGRGAAGKPRAGELTPQGRRERAASGLTSRIVVGYVERQGGRDAVDRFVDTLGIPEERLLDESAWFDFDTKMRFWDCAERVLGDPKVARNAGAAAMDLNLGAALKRALRALGTPELVYRNVVRANAKFTWAYRLEVLHVGNGRARVRFVDVSGVGYHPRECDYTAGVLAVVPRLFGLPAAHVSHVACGLRGDDGCEFEITWTGGAQRLRRAGVTLGLASAVTASVGVLALPAALPAAGVMLGAGGVALATRAIVYTCRRLQSLESRVVEQERAASRMFSSLADLSSDLRLDDVLDKITARASDAVGGKEFALLLADGGVVHADRHSGIPEESLRALEAWAAANRRQLESGRPVLFDDLATVPGLAPLAADPDVPLGSMCAATMTFRDRFVGVLVALAHGATVFLPHDSEALAGYAAQAAIAIENARLVDRLERQAGEDPLTGLANQRSFHRACEAEFARAEREHHPLAVVAVDLDHFKAINDTHGHPYGDDVLRGVGQALRRAVRPHDTVARLGGEEFALLLPGADGDAACAIAERARDEIASVPVSDRTLSASAGVAAHPESQAPPARLLQFADRALYTAKARGRGRTVRYEPDGGLPEPATPPSNELAHLLEPGAIQPVFQPVIAIATGQVIAYEALARFPTVPGRAVYEVFEIAQREGWGTRLEAAAVRAALTVPGRPPQARISVNVSLSGLCSPDVWAAFPEDLGHVIVELTENELVDSGGELERLLVRLRERGAMVALDDAGAGYSGLQQLMRVRPDAVKLDRSLISGVAHDPARAALVASFARFAAQTDWVICAEGVEDPDDLQALVELEVTYAQGYLIARPAAPWAGVDPAILESVAAPVRGGMRVVGEPVRDVVPESDDLDRLRAVIGATVRADRVEVWKREGDDLVSVDAPYERQPLASIPARRYVLSAHHAGQILRHDPEADPGELARLAALGYHAVLLLPVPGPGHTLGLIACYAGAGRPWGSDAVAGAQALAERLEPLLAGPQAVGTLRLAASS